MVYQMMILSNDNAPEISAKLSDDEVTTMAVLCLMLLIITVIIALRASYINNE